MGVMALQLAVGVFLSGAPQSYVLLKPSPTFFPPEGVPNEATTRTFYGCRDHSNETIVVRFIADAGEFIEVETLGAERDRELHCGATFVDDEAFNGQLGSYKLRLRVRRSDVATVLTRPLRTPTAEVAAGVPVEIIDGGLSFGLYGTTREFVLPADEALVGLTYVAARWKPVAPKWDGRGVRILAGAKAPVGDGGTVALLAGETWERSATERRGDEVVVRLSPACARLTTRVPAEELVSVATDEPLRGGTISLCGEVASTFVRAGATVYWPDGRIAGVMSQRDGLWGSTNTDGGTVCSDVTLQGVEVALPLCFRAADVFARPSK